MNVGKNDWRKQTLDSVGWGWGSHAWKRQWLSEDVKEGSGSEPHVQRPRAWCLVGAEGSQEAEADGVGIGDHTSKGWGGVGRQEGPCRSQEGGGLAPEAVGSHRKALSKRVPGPGWP